MQDLTRFALASNLKWLLLCGLAVWGAWLLYGSWRDVTAPAAASELVSPFGLWLPVLGKLVAALLLLLLGRWLNAQGWGADLVWSDGTWIPTEQVGTAPGGTADPAQSAREARGARWMPLFWTALFGTTLAGAIWQLPRHPPFYAPAVTVMLLAAFTLAGVTAIESWTRRLGADGSGLVDLTFFGAKRVPWQAIAGLRREDLNEEARASFERSSRRPGRRSGLEPHSIDVRHLVDAEERLILSFSDVLVPEDRFDEILRRAAAGAMGGAGAAPAATPPRSASAAPDARDRDDPANDVAAEVARADAEWERSSRAHDRLMRRGWLWLTSPFLLVTLWLGWNAFSYRFLAERTEGTVVAVEGSELRSLSVEYRDGDGNTHRIESDGTRGNLRYEPGDTLRVFYRAADPERARLDQFLELWLGTLISAGISALVSIPLLMMR